MTAFDGTAFGAQVVETIKTYLEREINPLKARVSELEKHPVKFVGVYNAGKVYEPNELAIHSGSLWICRSATLSRPGDDACWQLIVKQGTFSR